MGMKLIRNPNLIKKMKSIRWALISYQALSSPAVKTMWIPHALQCIKPVNSQSSPQPGFGRGGGGEEEVMRHVRQPFSNLNNNVDHAHRSWRRSHSRIGLQRATFPKAMDLSQALPKRPRKPISTKPIKLIKPEVPHRLTQKNLTIGTCQDNPFQLLSLAFR